MYITPPIGMSEQEMERQLQASKELSQRIRTDKAYAIRFGKLVMDRVAKGYDPERMAKLFGYDRPMKNSIPTKKSQLKKA